MLRIPSVVSLTCLLLAPASAAAAQGVLSRVSPATVGLSAERLSEVTDLLTRSVEEQQIPGAVVAVARHGQLAFLEAVGYQNLETHAAMTETSLFRIYSMSKTVTAVAVMMLHEEGKFELDDPVSKYLPEFAHVRVAQSLDAVGRPPSRPITVRDLLLHTSGLSHRTSEFYQEAQVRSRAIPMSKFIQNIVAAPLMEDPGTVYRYSAAPTVLGGLLEVWSGQSLDELLQDRIFGPLEMGDTGFWVEPARADRLTTVYRHSEAGGLRPYQIEEVPFTERPQLLEGAIGLISTVPDYVRFAQMLLNGGELGGVRLLEKETVAMMTSNGLSDAVMAGRGSAGIGWGLANVSIVLDPSDVGYPTSVGEYQRGGSAGTSIWVNPTEDFVIVLMWQSVPSNPQSLSRRVKTLVHEALLD